MGPRVEDSHSVFATLKVSKHIRETTYTIFSHLLLVAFLNISHHTLFVRAGVAAKEIEPTTFLKVLNSYFPNLMTGDDRCLDLEKC